MGAPQAGLVWGPPVTGQAVGLGRALLGPGRSSASPLDPCLASGSGLSWGVAAGWWSPRGACGAHRGVCTDTGLESAAWAGPEEFIQNEGRSLTSEPSHLDSGVSLQSPLSLTLHFTVLLRTIPKVN